MLKTKGKQQLAAKVEVKGSGGGQWERHSWQKQWCLQGPRGRSELGPFEGTENGT